MKRSTQSFGKTADGREATLFTVTNDNGIGNGTVC